MAFLNEQGLARLWLHITTKLSNKIDKEEGKSLSTNDYTNEDKEKLNNLDEIYAKADEVLTQDVTDSEQGNAVMANADLLGGVLASEYALKDEIPSLDEYALKDEVSSINHTHTYNDVGAAAINHTHAYNDVGAAAAAHTHTYNDVGAASVDHTHTAEDVGALPVNGTAVDAEKLGGYHASNYAKKDDVPSIEGLATKEYVDNKVSDVDLSNYATKDELQDYALTTDLGSYAAVSYVDNELNAVKSDLTENYLLKNESAVDSFKLGGKAPEYYSRPVNLFDNSNFEIAQAGYAGKHGDQAYAADRWPASSGFTVTHDGIGLKLTKDTSAANYARIRQVVSIGNLKGKTVTLAAYCKTSNKMQFYVWGYTTETEICTSYVNGNGSKDGVYIATFTIPDSLTDTYAVFSLAPDWDNSGVPVENLRMALYEGYYTVETLPPYVPKGYAAELLECQRYYVALRAFPGYSTPICEGYMANTNTGRALIYLPVPMRATPSLSYYNVTSIMMRSGGKEYTGASATVLGKTENGVVLHCVLPSGQSTSSFYAFSFCISNPSGGVAYLSLSADL